jgi:hypothetical protein
MLSQGPLNRWTLRLDLENTTGGLETVLTLQKYACLSPGQIVEFKIK